MPDVGSVFAKIRIEGLNQVLQDLSSTSQSLSKLRSDFTTTFNAIDKLAKSAGTALTNLGGAVQQSLGRVPGAVAPATQSISQFEKTLKRITGVRALSAVQKDIQALQSALTQTRLPGEIKAIEDGLKRLSAEARSLRNVADPIQKAVPPLSNFASELKRLTGVRALSTVMGDIRDLSVLLNRAKLPGEIKAIRDRMAELAKESRSLKGIAEPLQQAAPQIADFGNELRRLTGVRSFSAIQSDIRDLRSLLSRAQLPGEISAIRNRIRELGAEARTLRGIADPLRQAVPPIKDFGQELRRLTGVRSLGAVEKDIRDLSSLLRRAKLPGEIQAIRDKLKDLSAEARGIRGFPDLSPPIKNTNNALGGLLTSIRFFRGAVAALGISFLIREFRDLARTVIDVGREVINTSNTFRGVDIAFKVISGSSLGAAENLSFLRNEAQRLGIGLVTSIESFRGISAAARGTSLEGDQIRETFTAISEAARVLNLNNQRLSLTFLAVEQIIGKGVVSLEELRRQLGENLPGAVEIGARAMQLTTATFVKLVSAGQITAEEFIPRFTRQLKTEFAGGVQEASRTFLAATIRIGNALTDLKRSLGDFITQDPEIIQSLAKIQAVIIRLSQRLEDASPAAVAYAKRISELGQLLGITDLTLSISPEERLKQAQQTLKDYREEVEGLQNSIKLFGTIKQLPFISILLNIANPLIAQRIKTGQALIKEQERLVERLSKRIEQQGEVSKKAAEKLALQTAEFDIFGSRVNAATEDFNKFLKELKGINDFDPTGLVKLSKSVVELQGILNDTFKQEKFRVEFDIKTEDLKFGLDQITLLRNEQIDDLIKDVEKIPGAFQRLDPKVQSIIRAKQATDFSREVGTVQKLGQAFQGTGANIDVLSQRIEITKKRIEDLVKLRPGEKGVIQTQRENLAGLIQQARAVTFADAIAASNRLAASLEEGPSRELAQLEGLISATEKRLTELSGIKDFELNPKLMLERRDLEATVRQANQAFSELRLEVDLSDIDRFNEALRGTTLAFDPINEKIARVRSDLEKISTREGRLELKLTTEDAQARIATLRETLRNLTQEQTVKLIVDNKAFEYALQAAGLQSDALAEQMQTLQNEIKILTSQSDTLSQSLLRVKIDDLAAANIQHITQEFERSNIQITQFADAVRTTGFNFDELGERATLIRNAIEQFNTALTRNPNNEAAIKGLEEFQDKLRQIINLQYQVEDFQLFTPAQAEASARAIKEGILTPLEEAQRKIDAIRKSTGAAPLLDAEQSAKAIRKVNLEYNRTTFLGQALTGTVDALGDALINAELSAEGLGKALIRAFTSAILQAALKKLVDGLLSVVSVAGGVGAAGGGGGGFGVGIPATAKGRITQGPMLSLIGDNPSGRELVLPSERLSPRMEGYLSRSFLSGKRIDMPTIPKMASGAVVGPSPAGIVAASPAINISNSAPNITVINVASEREAEQVRREREAMRDFVVVTVANEVRNGRGSVIRREMFTRGR